MGGRRVRLTSTLNPTETEACCHLISFSFSRSVGPSPPSGRARKSLLGLLPSLTIQDGGPLPPLCRRREAAETWARFQGGSDPAATSITSSPLGNYADSRQTTLLLPNSSVILIVRAVFAFKGFLRPSAR